MKTCTLFSLLALAFTFSHCKSPTAVQTAQPSLLEVQQILLGTQAKFLQNAATTHGNPEQAIMLTANWVKAQPNVQLVNVLDSTYINITLKSGLFSTFSFNEVDASGHSLFAGGGSKTSEARLAVAGKHSANTITNKNVLIYCARCSEFYANNEIQTTVNFLQNSGAGLNVTLLMDEKCTPEIVDHFGDYGLVLIDTHGEQNGFESGLQLLIDTGVKTQTDLVQRMIDGWGIKQAHLTETALQDRDYIGVYVPIDRTNPNFLPENKSIFHVYVSTKRIDKLPPLTGTVIMGGMCYSGAENTFEVSDGFTPIKTSIMNKNPISYYCFSTDNGNSAKVRVVFVKSVMDSLAHALAIDLDSTKDAHLKPDHQTEYSEDGFLKLYFRHFGADNYSFNIGGCVDSFIDARDGHLYHTICIGKQTWMTENLRYNAPGSSCYNDSSSNCNKYGRLYDWKTMMNGAASSSTSPSNVQGICPKGWHLPSQGEFQSLLDFLGDKSFTAMKSISGWAGNGGNGTNTSGFNALPAGFRNINLNFQWVSQSAIFLSTTEKIGQDLQAWALNIQYYNTAGAVGYMSQGVAGSCRCLKD